MIIDYIKYYPTKEGYMIIHKGKEWTGRDWIGQDRRGEEGIGQDRNGEEWK